MKYHLSFLFFAFCNTFLYAQNVRPKEIVNQSPQAAALGKFLTIPVGYYTGIPETNVPIYTIKTKELSIPVRLTYHGGGIKVEEVASDVGLGWVLNAGGAIIQQVRGLPDDRSGGYMDDGIAQSIIDFRSYNREQRLFFAKDVLEYQSRDTEPDIFMYSFNGQSGKFFLDNDQVKTIPLTKLKISFDKVGSSWQITDTDGTKYVFSAKEEAETVAIGIPSSTISSTWYLSKIISATASEHISFNYRFELISYKTLNSEVSYRTTGGLTEYCVLPEASTIRNYTTVSSRILSSIDFPNGSVKFLPDDKIREDMPGSLSLKYIDIYDKRNILLKRTELMHSYSVNVEKRLFLDAVKTYDPQEPFTSENYSFDYYLRNDLPERTSYSQDYWGYFNAAYNNQLIPTVTVPSGLPSEPEITVPGANRNPSSKGLAGTLVKVNLPTGGIQEFDYEPNTVHNMSTTLVPKKYLPGGGGIHGELDGNNQLKLRYELAFHVPEDNIEIQYSLRNGPAQGQGAPGPLGYIYDSSGNIMFRIPYPITNDTYKFVKKGTYRFRIDFTNNEEWINKFHFGVQILAPKGSYDTVRTSRNDPVGGFRLKRSRLTDAISGKTLERYYTYTKKSGESSGTLPSQLSFVENYTTSMGGCTVLKLSSASNAPLTLTGGAVAGYAHVTEYLGAQGEFGKNEYSYTSPSGSPDKIWRKPWALTSREHHRGILTGEINYRFENGKYFPVKKTSNIYGDTDQQVGAALKIGSNMVDPEFFEIDPVTHQSNMYRSSYYDIETDRTHLTQQFITSYAGQDSITTTYDYEYSAKNYLLAKSIKGNSAGNLVTTLFRYPVDMGLKGEHSPYQAMIDFNIINPIIEEERLQGGLPIYFLKNEYSSPFPHVFVPVSILLRNGNGSLETKTQYTYDKYGNLISVSNNGGAKRYYLWTYDHQHPIAEVTNLDLATIEALLGGRAEMDAFASGNPSEDEVRNFLRPLINTQKAMISFYTYKPMLGMTSSTDAKGQAIYYEYDGLQRLKHIKDQNGHIVKSYEYHLKP